MSMWRELAPSAQQWSTLLCHGSWKSGIEGHMKFMAPLFAPLPSKHLCLPENQSKNMSLETLPRGHPGKPHARILVQFTRQLRTMPSPRGISLCFPSSKLL